MSITLDSVTKINSLKSGIEAVTGESYSNLTEAVQDLKNGYGVGEGGDETQWSIDDLASGTVPKGDIQIGAVAIRQAVFTRCANITSIVCDGSTFTSNSGSAFSYASGVKTVTLKNVTGSLPALVFAYMQSCHTVKFIGSHPETITNNCFTGLGNIYVGANARNIDIYVPWAEGAIANAPWGATKATIHYNTVYDANGNPIEEE